MLHLPVLLRRHGCVVVAAQSNRQYDAVGWLKELDRIRLGTGARLMLAVTPLLSRPVVRQQVAAVLCLLQ